MKFAVEVSDPQDTVCVWGEPHLCLTDTDFIFFFSFFLKSGLTVIVLCCALHYCPFLVLTNRYLTALVAFFSSDQDEL